MPKNWRKQTKHRKLHTKKIQDFKLKLKRTSASETYALHKVQKRKKNEHVVENYSPESELDA